MKKLDNVCFFYVYGRLVCNLNFLLVRVAIMKIGQYVREHLIPLLEKLDQDDFKRFLDDVAIGKTKDIFGLHNASEKIPFLVLKGMRMVV